jgi:hypothetical protein
MTNDLAKRLRDFTCDCFSGNSKHMTWEAADRIEQLEKALRRIEESEDQFSMQWAAEIARAALKGETE